LQGSTKSVVLALFFLSGACTLIYQVVWTRMLVPVFGTSVFAISTVLTAFMAGLALGSFYFGRVADKKVNALRLYAFLELGIGAFALVFPLVLLGLDEIYTFLYRHLDSSHYTFALCRFLLCFVVLLVPTTLMGATLPVLSRFAVRSMEQIGWSIGGLYAVNTFGATCGCFAAAFVLLEHLGVSATTYVAAGGNLFIAAISWWWSRKVAEPPAAVAATIADESQPQTQSRLVVPLVLLAFALSGFAALGYEVVWTRLLSMILRSATAQTLSTILIAFLFGLAAGGMAGARWIDGRKDLLSIFGVIELLLGFFGLLSIAAFGAIPYILPTIYSSPSWEQHLLKLFAVAFGVMLIPTFLMGVLFPLVGRLHVLGLANLGRRIGDVYAVNTLGAIFGAFAAGFILIPLLGTQKSIQGLAWLNVVLGTMLLLINPAASWRKKLSALLIPLVPTLFLALSLPADFLVSLFEWSEPRSRLAYCREDAEGTVTVHEYRDGARLLKVNGGGEVPTDFASIQTFRLLGNLPMVLHPDPQEVLVIAFGGGITLSSVVQHQPRRVDCAEVVPGVIEAASYFARYNHQVYKRFGTPAVALIADDGRNHVLRTQERYDVIISDATHPGTADSWVLYTEDFYRLCLSRLQEGGMVAQWLPLHGLSTADYHMILRTFQAVFPHASLWLTGEYTVLLGPPAPLRINFEQLQQRLQRPGVQQDLAAVDLGDPISFLSALALEADDLKRYAGTGRTNTDNRPHISFTDRLRGDSGSGFPALSSMGPQMVESVDPHLIEAKSAVVDARLEQRFKARKHTVAGEIARRQGDEQMAMEAFKRALEIDPDELGALRTLRSWKQHSRRKE
jgi:spermidine synthase